MRAEIWTAQWLAELVREMDLTERELERLLERRRALGPPPPGFMAAYRDALRRCGRVHE
jgi:hypothetical protein